MEKFEKLTTLEEKINYFDEYMKDDTTSTYFMIPIPSDLQPIGNKEPQCVEQYKEALIFAEHIKKTRNTEHVELLIDCLQVNLSPILNKIDQVIFLHKPWEPEKKFIINAVINGTIPKGFKNTQFI